MKLRNKRTGELGINEGEGIEDKRFCIRSEKTGRFYIYNSLAELSDEWKDYKPVEPLIKDEEVRELVRKWAKINCLKIVKSYGHEAWVGLCGDDEKNRGIWSIELRSEYLSELEPNQEYTIDELCGEEEE